MFEFGIAWPAHRWKIWPYRKRMFGLLFFMVVSLLLIMPVSADVWVHEVEAKGGRLGLGPFFSYEIQGRKGTSLACSPEHFFGILHMTEWEGGAFLSYECKYLDGEQGGFHSWEGVNTLINVGYASIPRLDYDPVTHRERMSISSLGGEVVYAWRDSGTNFICESIDDEDYPSSSLVSFAQNRSGIAYVHGGLQYAEQDSNGIWHIASVDPGITSYPSLAIDSAGNPAIAYYSPGTDGISLKIAYRDPHGWHVVPLDSPVDPGEEGEVSLVFDGSNNPHIAYFKKIDPQHGELRYIAYRTVSLPFPPYSESYWTDPVVVDSGNAGEWADIAVTSEGAPRIVYYDRSTDRLNFVYRDPFGPTSVSDPTWNKLTLFSSKVGGWCNSIDIDVYGCEHISSYNNETSSLDHVWRVHPVDNRAVFRASTWSNWIIDKKDDGVIDTRDHLGSSTDIPLIGDFYENGTPDRALFRSGEWIIDLDMDGTIDMRHWYGLPGDIPMVGRMNSDWSTDRAVFRSGQWIIDYSMDGSVNARDNYGSPGDIPLIGDFNNDGNPDRAVFRASTWNNWIIDYDMDGSVDKRDHYGAAGDIPVISDFNNDEKTDRAVFRAGEWIIDYNMDGSIDSRTRFGMAGDRPFAWDL